MRITLLATLLLTQSVLANNLKDDEYAGIKIGSQADSAIKLLKNYQSQEVFYDEPQSCFYLEPKTHADGPYIMVMDGIVVRFDIDEQLSQIQTQEGLGIDSSKADVIKTYNDVKVSVHPYLGEEGEYLEVKLNNGNGLIFETYRDKVTSFRLGSYPAILYIEGCA
ncbi:MULTISPECIES: hypothetical protein [Alteromonadaceae]|uniref:hypothetical protein n=1 Tax=Alteromonadaceae TaxID=72275 RepID=UPI001C08A38A|nr:MULTISPECIES: hypothetical protein [Aliiglaciecola]MBU2878097.1 hypothetical protein [Aliiglaciecola lipolytica]MDO6709462.1 hypothetical protein [Aliiglaciecola sp. 2_MG-2023]MDO6750610.1 hypothetical protein [Aliiglaciecola sp. 1_MG-2023]